MTAVSIATLIIVLVSLIFIDWPGKDDVDNLGDTIDENFANLTQKVDSLEEEIALLRQQQLESSDKLIETTLSLKPEKNNLRLGFFFVDGTTKDKVEDLCNNYNVQKCLTDSTIEEVFPNGSYSLARAVVNNADDVVQGPLTFLLDCTPLLDSKVAFFRAMVQNPANVLSYSSTLGNVWSIKIEEIPPYGAVQIDFPYQVEAGESSICRVQYYSETSHSYAEEWSIKNFEISKAS